MINRIIFFLCIGFVLGQDKKDKIVHKNGDQYEGIWEKIEDDMVFFQSKDIPRNQTYFISDIKKLELSNGVIVIWNGIYLDDLYKKRLQKQLDTLVVRCSIACLFIMPFILDLIINPIRL